MSFLDRPRVAIKASASQRGGGACVLETKMKSHFVILFSFSMLILVVWTTVFRVRKLGAHICNYNPNVKVEMCSMCSVSHLEGCTLENVTKHISTIAPTRELMDHLVRMALSRAGGFEESKSARCSPSSSEKYVARPDY